MWLRRLKLWRQARDIAVIYKFIKRVKQKNLLTLARAEIIVPYSSQRVYRAVVYIGCWSAPFPQQISYAAH